MNNKEIIESLVEINKYTLEYSSGTIEAMINGLIAEIKENKGGDIELYDDVSCSCGFEGSAPNLCPECLQYDCLYPMEETK